MNIKRQRGPEDRSAEKNTVRLRLKALTLHIEDMIKDTEEAEQVIQKLEATDVVVSARAGSERSKTKVIDL